MKTGALGRVPYRRERYGQNVGRYGNFINENKDSGGPGGAAQIVDFIIFFVGKPRKASRIVPYRSAGPPSIAAPSPGNLESTLANKNH